MTAPTATAPYTASTIDGLPQLWDGLAKLVREGLGITAFGVQIMDLPPNYTTDAHDETETGQEELYIALRGHGAVIIDDAGVLLDGEHVVVVPPQTARTLTSGPDGLRVLCVGGTPGQPYSAPEWTEGVLD